MMNDAVCFSRSSVRKTQTGKGKEDGDGDKLQADVFMGKASKAALCA